MKKRLWTLAATLMTMVCMAAGCGSTTTSGGTTNTSETSVVTEAIGESGTSEASSGGHFNMGVSFWYELDAHKDYNGWYTSMYGLTETLFKVQDDYSVEGWLADSASNDGNTWTITLKDGLVFSNGDPVTADIVIKNLQRAGEVNTRATVLASATYEAVDDKTFTITTAEACPTMMSDLADPYTSIMDVDAVENDDYNNGIIATGPFKLVSYAAENSVMLARNENYWCGDVTLDEVNVYYIPDVSTEATSLQSGEIDMYVGPDSDSIDIFSADSNYVVTSVPTTKVDYYLFNMNTVTDMNVRKAIIMAVNKSDIAALLNNTLSVCSGAYGTDSALGKVEAPDYDLEASKQLMEEAGYTLDANGYYAKDGQELTLNMAYYAAKSLDKITTLIQDELKTAGFNINLSLYEDPDATYMMTGDFDIAIYSHGTTTSGDAYAYLNEALSTEGNINGGNYSNSEVDALLEQMFLETDADKRTEFAVQIQQKALDDCAVSYFGIPTKTTIMKATVSNVSENNPLTIYVVNKDTAIAK